MEGIQIHIDTNVRVPAGHRAEQITQHDLPTQGIKSDAPTPPFSENLALALRTRKQQGSGEVNVREGIYIDLSKRVFSSVAESDLQGEIRRGRNLKNELSCHCIDIEGQGRKTQDRRRS